MSKLYFCLFILLIIFSKSFFQEKNQLFPSLIRLTINGTNLGNVEKILIKKLLVPQEIPLETIYVSENIDILGKLKLVLNNTIIKITNSTDAELYLSFAEEKNINFNLNILNGIITFDYNFQTGLISGEGNCTLYLNNISLALNNTLILVPNKYEPEKNGPGLAIQGVVFNDLDMDLKFSKNGTLEKFLRYFNKNLKNIALKIAEYEINKNNVLQNINSQLFDLFSTIHLNIAADNLFQTDDNVSISFALSEDYLFKNNVLELSLFAELISNNYKYEEEYSGTLPYLINSDMLTEKTLNGIVSQFIANNILDLFYFFGKLNFTITNDTLSLTEINVGTISAIINEITNGYKAGQKAKIYAKAIESPILKIYENNKLNLKLFMNLKFFVYDENTNPNEDKGTIPVDANSNIDVDANFFFNDKNIQLTLNSVQMTSFEVQNSLVGEINTDKVINNFKTFMTFMLANINKSINKMIENIPKPLSFEDINLNELVIQSYEECLKFDVSPILNLTKLLI